MVTIGAIFGEVFTTILILQSIPGIPPVLVSGNNARPIIEVTNSIWKSSGIIFMLLTVVGIWMSQFKMVSEKTGGPGQYLARCLTVGLSLAGYKIIFALIMWTGALVAFQIFPIQPNATQNTVIPWLPAGTISSTVGSTANSAGSQNNTNSNASGETKQPFQISPKTTVMDMIWWGIKSSYQVTFQALPATLFVGLCNLFFIMALFLITAFWLTFAVILYALGPLMIMAGLIPTYGDKLWGNWIGATIQCSLWQVWMAFCGKLITSSFFIQISQLNPMNRVDGGSGGGEMSTAVMDMQQAAYALVFLILYVATPLVANYVFPLGASAGLGAFMLNTATAAATKVARGAAAIKTGGASEAVMQGASQGAKQGTAQAGAALSGAKNTATNDTGNIYNSGKSSSNKSSSNSQNTDSEKNNQIGVVQSNTSVGSGGVSYDGTSRTLAQDKSIDSSTVASGLDDTQRGSTTISQNSDKKSVNTNSTSDNYNSESNSYQSGKNAGNQNSTIDMNDSYSGNESSGISPNSGQSSRYYRENEFGGSKYGPKENGGNYETTSENYASRSNNSSYANQTQNSYGDKSTTGKHFENDAAVLNESIQPSDIRSGGENQPKTVYTASSERPKDVSFGKLPTKEGSLNKTDMKFKQNTSARNDDE